MGATLITKTADTSPTSDDITYTVNDPAGTPADRKVTLGNLITKAHGLSDGFPRINAGVIQSDTATNFRTAVGLAIGTDVQAQGATLTSLEGLSLAAGDIVYATAADTLARLPVGTANQLLRTNAGATAPEWYTLSSSGQTLVTHIVAASGGTHTTLGAAITAASSGDTIYVREGTYVETTITTALTDLTIIGENPSSSIINLGTTNATFSGTNVTIQNVAFTSSTGKLILSGTYARLKGCNLTISGNAIQLTVSQTGSRITDCSFFDTNVSTHTAETISISGVGVDFSNNYCSAAPRVGDNATGWLKAGGTNCSVIGNKFNLASVAASSVVLSLTAARVNVIGNSFNTGAASTISRIIYNIGANAQIIGNTIVDAITGIYNVYDAKIIGNDIYALGSGGVGIEVQGAYVNIYNNRIAATTTCVNVGAVTWTKVHSNFFGSSTNGVVTNANATYTDIVGNTFNTNITNFITDGSPSTNIRSNTGIPITLEKHMYRMKNTSGGAFAAGDIVILKAVAAGDEVTSTTTASDNSVFGMCVESIADTAYGYVQTLGKTTLLKVDGTTDIAIGDFITTFTTAKIGQKGAAGNVVFAKALEAYTGNDSNGVIDALLINKFQMA